MESLREAVGPIGTLEELVQIGADPKRIESCSRRTGRSAGGNRGCPWFDKCRFTAWRDKVNGLKGPLNVGVEVMLSQLDGGAHNQFQISCFDYYATHLHERKRQGEDSGELVRIVAYEGDGKEIREWESKHVPDPNVQGGGRKVERYIKQHAVTPFPRPAERFPMEVGRERAKVEILDEVEREALSNVLRRQSPQMPEPEKAETTKHEGPVGPGRKVKDGERIS